MANVVSSSYTVKRVQGRSPGKGSTFWDHHTVNTVPQFWRDLQSTPWSQTVELWEFLSSSNNYVAINIWQLTHSCESSLAKWEIKVFWNLEWGGGALIEPRWSWYLKHKQFWGSCTSVNGLLPGILENWSSSAWKLWYPWMGWCPEGYAYSNLSMLQGDCQIVKPRVK